MSDEYKSNLAEQIANLDENLLQDKQKAINKSINKREQELNFEQDKFKKEVIKNKKKFYLYIAFISLLFFSIMIIFFYFQKKMLNHANITKNSTIYVLKQLQDEVFKIPQGKILKNPSKKDLVINQKIVPYQGKKYLKILNTDLMQIKTQPKYQYLQIKN